MVCKAESQGLPLPGTIHRTLLSIHVQPKFAFHEPYHAVQCSLGSTLAANIYVVFRERRIEDWLQNL